MGLNRIDETLEGDARRLGTYITKEMVDYAAKNIEQTKEMYRRASNAAVEGGYRDDSVQYWLARAFNASPEVAKSISRRYQKKEIAWIRADDIDTAIAVASDDKRKKGVHRAEVEPPMTQYSKKADALEQTIRNEWAEGLFDTVRKKWGAKSASYEKMLTFWMLKDGFAEKVTIKLPYIGEIRRHIQKIEREKTAAKPGGIGYARKMEKVANYDMYPLIKMDDRKTKALKTAIMQQADPARYKAWRDKQMKGESSARKVLKRIIFSRLTENLLRASES